MVSQLVVAPVIGKRERELFIDVAYRLNRDDRNWVPPLRAEVAELLDVGRSPFFEHAEMQLFLARRDGRITGRISAHIDFLQHEVPPEQGMGPGTGNWGLFEAEDEETAAALISAAESWLREMGMVRVLAPFSLSIWDEPGLLVKGHEHPPVILMGHHSPRYREWIENCGYQRVKTLLTYDLDVVAGFPPLVNRIVASGEKNPRIRIREADIHHVQREADTLFQILNDAWSTNWGFVPITDREIRYITKKLRPLVKPELLRFAELDGEPVAFMLTFPDLNRLIKPFDGRLLPFNWLKLLLWTRRPKSSRARVPLMGVVKRLQASRLASQLAFMLIEYIRRDGVAKYGFQTAEIGWILDDNQGMLSIADAIGSKVNREYAIYGKDL